MEWVEVPRVWAFCALMLSFSLYLSYGRDRDIGGILLCKA